MKHRTVLLAAIFTLVSAPAVAAEKSVAGKPATGHSDEQTGAPAGEHKLDFKELFGCEPMGEDGHMTPEPASEKAEQETSQPAQEQGPTQ